MWLSPDAPPLYVGGLIGATVVLICGSVAVIWWRRKKRAKAYRELETVQNEISKAAWDKQHKRQRE